MKYRTSDIFNSKNIKRSIHQQNSTFSSPYQSKHPKLQDDNQGIRISSVKYNNQTQKQKVYFRSQLSISYTPQYSILSQNNMTITIKIKQYTLQLLPWLIKKDSLFRINIVLGVYIAFLQLIDVYGLFPLHPNLMRVNQKQQVAVWINKNYQACQPDQVLVRNALTLKQFVKSFIKIFYCCLPNKKISEIYNDPKQLLAQLVKIKRKQQMHKNCHQFLKFNNNKGTISKQSYRCNSNYFYQTQNSSNLIQSSNFHHHKNQSQSKFILNRNQEHRYSTRLISRYSNSPRKIKNRQSSFSPVRRQEKSTSLNNRFSKTGVFIKSQKPSSTINVPHFIKKKSQQSLKNLNNRSHPNASTSNVRMSTKQMTLSSTGQLFKRYLMYNTSKFQKMSKNNFVQSQTFIDYGGNNHSGSKHTFIFKSDVHRIGDNITSMPILEEPFVYQNTNKQKWKKKNQFSQQKSIFSPIKFRKMSNNTNENKNQEEKKKKTFLGSGNWRRTTYKEQQNYQFSNQCQDSPKNQTKQKLKSSFPYKTASTLTSFRLSNQNQIGIIPSKSQQNLNNCLNTSPLPLCMKQKDKKIQQMKIQEQNELESDFNNIFSMQNSNLKKQEDDLKLQKILNQFQQVLF